MAQLKAGSTVGGKTIATTLDVTKGKTFTGIVTAHSNTSYTVRQVRNIILSPSDANVALMQDGDVWIKYK